jgi:ABC-2 type transport system permease protein
VTARVTAQARFELRLLARNGESLLLVVGLPVLLLIFFTAVDVLPTGTVVDDPIDFLAPGVLALAVMSTAFVNLAIGTGFDREYGVLKRFGATPLRTGELVGAKVAVVGLTEVVQVAVVTGVALALGWSPSAGGAAAAIAAGVLATVAFVGLGLLLAGTLGGLVVLAAANALYIVLLLLSGMVIPLDELPAWLSAISRLLPSTALAEIVHGALEATTAVPARAWAVLAVWAIAAPVAAARWFRWER